MFRSFGHSFVRSFRRAIVPFFVPSANSFDRSAGRSFLSSFSASFRRPFVRSCRRWFGRSVVSVFHRSVVPCFVPSTIRSVVPSFVRSVGLRPGRAGRSFGCSVGRSFLRSVYVIRLFHRMCCSVRHASTCILCMPLSQLRLETINTIKNQNDERQFHASNQTCARAPLSSRRSTDRSVDTSGRSVNQSVPSVGQRGGSPHASHDRLSPEQGSTVELTINPFGTPCKEYMG